MSKYILTSILSFFLSINNQKVDTVSNIYLIHTAGQSNLGTGATPAPTRAELLAEIDSGYYYNGTSIITLDYNNTGGHGAEYGCSYALKSIGNISYWTKEGHGATGLELDWLKGSTNYNLALAKLIGLKDSLDARGLIYIPIFYWNQWERDATVLSYAQNYYSNFLQFISDIESDAGITFDKIITVRALTTAKTTELGYTRDYADTVRNRQDSILNYSSLSSRYYLINIDDVTVVEDGTHYTSTYMQDTVAIRLKEIILQ